MKSSKEIRAEARKILRNGWFWRLLSVGMLLYAVYYFVQILLALMMARNGVNSGGILALGLQSFFSLIFGAITAFGIASAALKALRNESNRWFADSMGGFQRPFSVAGLLLIMNLKVMLWSLLFIVPGIVAMYRYRQAWYLKTENPEMKATECLRKSGEMMVGKKWAAFKLDCSFIGWALLVMVLMTLAGLPAALNAVAELEGGAGVGVGAVMQAVSSISGMIGLGLFAYLAVYYMTARAVFYKVVSG